MLSAFLVEHRREILARCHARLDLTATPAIDADGLPTFLDQLVAALAGGRDDLAIAAAATRHGAALVRRGGSVGDVVHHYGNACQSITELAIEHGLAITTQDFKILNRCLDDAIADAVTEHTRQRELEITAATARRELQDLGEFGHELRNLLAVATLAFEALRSGSVGIAGTTGSMLGRSLGSLNVLVDRTLATVRIDTAMVAPERITIDELVVDLEIAAILQASVRNLHLVVEHYGRGAAILADREVLGSVLYNLVQNAFKYTRPRSRVILRTMADATHVRVEVEDECGGLPAGKIETLFEPFQRLGHDRSGLGLGLAISARSVRASGGTITARDVPGKGCVFTVELPRLIPA